MGKVFFTADLHFGHENVIKFDNRPFKTVEEMDEELIRRWNAKVGKGDLVYVLGDMIWKTRNSDAETLIKRLNGQIILIKGNHDRFLHNAKAKNALAGVKDYDDICIKLEDGSERRVILSHYYIPFYIGHRHNGIHLYGHSHNTDEYAQETKIKFMLERAGYDTLSINVGCMHWNYEPVTLDEILEGMMKLHAELAEMESRAKSRAMVESLHHHPRLRLSHTQAPPLTWEDYKSYASKIDPEFRQMLEEIKVEISPNPAYVETDAFKQQMQEHCFALSRNASPYYLSYLGLTKGQILMHMRMRQKLTQIEVAERVGLSLEAYLAYERDEPDLSEIPAKTLFAIARILHTTASELIEDYKR